MPSAKVSKRQVSDLEKELAEARKVIGKLQKTVQKQKPVNEGQLISKPTGQAGRRSGFQLRPSMGLRKPHYNRLMRMTRFCANVFLDPRKNFLEQEKKRVEAVISYVRKNVKGFKYYREGWPIRCMIIQHLANSKKRWSQDLKIENAELRRPNKEAIAAYKDSLGKKLGKSREGDAESSEDETKGLQEEEEEEEDFFVLDTLEDDNKTDAEDADNEVDEEVAGASEIGSENNGDEDEMPARVSAPKSRRVEVPQPGGLHTRNKKIRTREDSERPSGEYPVKRLRIDKGALYSGTKCPEYDCEDVVPEFPSESLRTQLEELAKIRFQGMGGTPYTLSALICLAIKRERAFPGLKLLGERFKWPSNIDFESLSDRIFYRLRPELLEIIANHIVLGCSLAWTAFSKILQDANTPLIKFSQARDSVKFGIAGKVKHAGYYGPKGEFIILATLDRFFNETLSTVLLLTSTLKDVFLNETVESEPGEAYHRFWEDIDSAFNTPPIQLRDFFAYILLPEIATLLIAEDLRIGKAEAYGIWVRSKDFGNAFNGNIDDGTIDDINNKNIMAQRLGRGVENGPLPPRVGRKWPLALPPVRNATPGPGPQTAARIAAAKEFSPIQNSKSGKSAKLPPKVTNAEPERRSNRKGKGKGVRGKK